MKEEQLLQLSMEASLAAGKKILEVYKGDFEVAIKKDDSPITLADRASHDIIENYLEKTNIPVLSEEGRTIPYEERKHWSELWVVDPLDGTKEFIKKNGEFTVNIALVKNEQVRLGVIYIPVQDVLYFAAGELGSYKLNEAMQYFGDFKELSDWINRAEKLPLEQDKDAFTVVASRSHFSKDTKDFLEILQKKHGELALIYSGSSIKFCIVAEGRADLYPRFAPTMEWDTAAGQIILDEAGYELIDYDTQEPMLYNRQNLKNNWFLVRQKEG